MDRFLCLALVTVALALAGCQGRPVGMTAQQGSSVVIPLSDATNPDAAAYGGTTAPDYQRGTLIFRLDGPTGMELVTRAATVVTPASSSKASKDGLNFVVPRQIMVLVDVPTNAPLGAHSLHVVRRRVEGGVPVEYPGPGYAGQLTVLPNQIDVGGTLVTGQSTPFHYYGGGWWPIGNASIANVLPRPELQLAIYPEVHSIELQVDYPAGVIDVQDSFQTIHNTVPINERGVVWHDDDGVGRVVISGAATTPGRAIDQLSLVFTLDNGATAILDPEDVTLTVLEATDADGAPVSATAEVLGVF